MEAAAPSMEEEGHLVSTDWLRHWIVGLSGEELTVFLTIYLSIYLTVCCLLSAVFCLLSAVCSHIRMHPQKQRAREEAVKAVDLTRDDDEGAGADADGDAAMGTSGEVIPFTILTPF
jgi:hypothetical protein